MRIVSLLPSATEIVCAVGQRHHLVGVSHSCDYPHDVVAVPTITSTRVPYTESSATIDAFVRSHLTDNSALYELNMAALEKASPDVIVSQALCDVCAVSTGDVVAALESLPSQPLLIDLEPNTLSDVFDDCIRVGEALNAIGEAETLVADLKRRCAAVEQRSAGIANGDRPRVVFLEWMDPPFSGGHWNPQLVNMAGGIDLLGSPSEPSKTLSWQQIVDQQPDVLYIACCGYSREQVAIDVELVAQEDWWNDIPAVANNKVFIADGDAYFARPGPRLVDGLELLAHSLHPDVHPLRHC